MSADFSRERFDPFKDFAGVLMQQGRVQLDADWNELVDIVDRRLRAETTDIIGRAVVPNETPDGFKIDIPAGGPTIGRGRMYVDGLLAENHGAAPLEFDAVLAEQRGTQPLPYNAQPYFPGVDTVAPFPTQGGPHLVYLDVWDREVTYLEDPDLVEIAVGVDSTARTQTAWQVRVLPNVGNGVDCSTPDNDVEGWPAIIAPSAGRLTTRAVGVPEEDDPCLTPPTGGFRGLENRLYRVEIQDGGAPGTATWKWSRDNASVATAVTGLPDLSNLIVVRTGRDAELRFSAGDWLEVTDDNRELSGAAGIIARVLDVKDATRTITLASPLPAGLFPVDAEGNTDPARHTRIRRWDQTKQVSDTNGNLLVDLDLPGSTGVIPVPADGISVVLEDGVQVTFSTSPVGGDYHIGDYWVFAARTADASVEGLNEAPPRGVHHHFARLAVVTLPNDVIDCRTHWPPPFGETGCDCTVCVSPQDGPDAIQNAINQVKAVGGTICLGAGVYLLRAPLSITGAQSLKIHGHGWKTQLIYLAGGAAIRIENSIGVELEEMAVVTSGALASSGMAIGARNVAGLTVQRCVLLQLGVGETSLAAIGLTGIIAAAFLRENAILGARGISSIGAPRLQDNIANLAAANAFLLTAGLVIQDNFLICRQRGVDLSGTVVHAGPSRIDGNFVLGCTGGGIISLGLTTPGSGIQIAQNQLTTSGDAIRAGTDGCQVFANHIEGLIRTAGSGVVLAGTRKLPLDRCEVTNNEIIRVGGVGIDIQSGLHTAQIRGNTIEAAGLGGIIMKDESSADSIVIENNHLMRICPTTNDRAVPVAGIRTWNASHGSISGNVVLGVGENAVQSPSRAGIEAIGPSQSLRIGDNDVADVGPPGEFVGESAGIAYAGLYGQLEISDNRVRRLQADLPDAGAGSWLALAIQAPLLNHDIAGTNFRFLVTATLAFAVLGAKVVRLPKGNQLVTIDGNQLEAFGRVESVRVFTPGSCVFTSNQCVLDLQASGANVDLTVGSVAASNNFVESNGDIAMRLTVPANGAFTVVGNITRGQIQVNGAPLAAPWAPLNVAA